MDCSLCVNPLNAIYLLAKDLKFVDLELIEQEKKLLEVKSTKDQYFGLSDLCLGKAYRHPEWNLLAGRILMHQIKSQVPPKFSGSVKKLRSTCNDEYFAFVMKNKD